MKDKTNPKIYQSYSGQMRYALFPLLTGLSCLFILSSVSASRLAQKTSKLKPVKDFIADTVSPQKIDKSLRYLTAEPHVASSEQNNRLAEFIAERWKASGVEAVHMERYDVLLSFPKKIAVKLISPNRYELALKEKGYEEDPDTLKDNVGIPYNAYSRSGKITAPLVYANGGNPQDYELLESKGISLEGKIALIRYSVPYSYRGFKAFTAEKKGLAGILIYSDPEEDGCTRGKTFPEGPWGPSSHIQRGGIPYDFIYPGDPLTPGWASTPGSRRLSQKEAVTIPNILSVPISAEDALHLLKALDGEEAPKDWQGALPITYRLEGSQAFVHMDVKMEDSIRTITNVLGSIKAEEDTDEFVLAGNHRDAWVFGGHDPSSGTACLIELARVLGEAKKAGYKLKRNIVFANWDAEEFTLTGSTEWGEHYKKELGKNLVAYLNVDSSASGRDFSVQATPCLSSLVIRAIGTVKDPVSKEDTVLDIWKNAVSEKGTIVLATGSGTIEPLGSGTDHTVFLNHIGVPCLNMSFSGDYGVYHSMYDSYYWMKHFGDPGMLYTAALVKIWANMLIDLTTETILPLDYENYAVELERYLEEWAARHDPSRAKSKRLFILIKKMKASAARITPFIFKNVHLPEKKAAPINRLLMEIERVFTLPEGIPNRPWFKHQIYGTRYTYAVLLLPGLTEAAEAKDEENVVREIKNLECAVQMANQKLEDISSLLREE